MDQPRTSGLPAVQQLGYLGLATADLAGWVRLCRDILDCDVSQESEDWAEVRIDNRHRRLTLRQSEGERLDHVGWQVADAEALERIGVGLEASGFAVREAEQSLITARGVTNLLQVADASGLPLELYFGDAKTDSDFVPRWPHSGFVADELGLGHMVLATPHYQETVNFYVELLGFRISDYIDHPAGWDATFLHCNPRHHSLAIVRQPDPNARASLHHFLLESRTLDDVGRVLDKCLSSGVHVTQSLGRHTNDLMVSFYLSTPSGFQIEYGALGRLVDDRDWQVVNYASPSIWGHLPREGFTVPTARDDRTGTAQNSYTMGR